MFCCVLFCPLSFLPRRRLLSGPCRALTVRQSTRQCCHSHFSVLCSLLYPLPSPCLSITLSHGVYSFRCGCCPSLPSVFPALYAVLAALVRSRWARFCDPSATPQRRDQRSGGYQDVNLRQCFASATTHHRRRATRGI